MIIKSIILFITITCGCGYGFGWGFLSTGKWGWGWGVGCSPTHGVPDKVKDTQEENAIIDSPDNNTESAGFGEIVILVISLIVGIVFLLGMLNKYLD